MKQGLAISVNSKIYGDGSFDRGSIYKRCSVNKTVGLKLVAVCPVVRCVNSFHHSDRSVFYSTVTSGGFGKRSRFGYRLVYIDRSL